MKHAAILLLILIAGRGFAATAYVSDDLVLGVFSEQNQQGQRLTTLHSGASVETLDTAGEYTQVRLGNGTIGWVKSSFLVERIPAAARVKELEDELSRAHATTPALAEAAARSEVEQLKSQLAATEEQLQTARTAAQAVPTAPALGQSASRAAAKLATDLPLLAWTAAVGAVVLLALGFWLGYNTLARRVKAKFGGIKVY